MGWEERFLLFLQESVRNPVLDRVMQFVTSLGDAGFLAILVCIVLLCIKKYRRTGAAAALSLSLDFLAVNLILKNLVARIRPYDILEELILITKRPSDLSFPSGHAGACFAVASVMFLCLPRRFGIGALVTAGLISFSRLYVGAHYPTDVLGGMLIGCITGWAACRLLQGGKQVQKNTEESDV